MPINVGSLLQAEYYSQYAEQVGINVIHYVVTAVTGGPVSFVEVASRMYDRWAVPMSNCTTTGVQVQGVIVRDLLQPLLAGGLSDRFPIAGTNEAEPLPRQVAGFIRKRSLFSGRSFNGRMYVPFPGENVNESPPGIPTAAYMNVLAILGAAVLPLAPVTETDGVFSYTYKCVIASVPELTHVDLNARQNVQKWATQRRRGSFGAANVSPF